MWLCGKFIQRDSGRDRGFTQELFSIFNTFLCAFSLHPRCSCCFAFRTGWCTPCGKAGKIRTVSLSHTWQRWATCWEPPSWLSASTSCGSSGTRTVMWVTNVFLWPLTRRSNYSIFAVLTYCLEWLLVGLGMWHKNKLLKVPDDLLASKDSKGGKASPSSQTGWFLVHLVRKASLMLTLSAL